MRDNRYNGTAITDYDYETKQTVVRYNSYRIGKKPDYYIISCVFHEIRHIIQGDIPYETDDQQIYCELDAEQYAVDMMKNFYPDDFKKHVKYVKEYELGSAKWRKGCPNHFKAFSQINEYSNNNRIKRK